MPNDKSTKEESAFLKKRIKSIALADNVMELKFRSLKIVNEFKWLGFDKWPSFLGVVQHTMEKYQNENGKKMLQAFWNTRTFREDIMEDLEFVLEKLKSE